MTDANSVGAGPLGPDGGQVRYDVLMTGNPFCDLTFSFPHLEVLPSLGQEVYADEFAVNPGGAFNSASALSRLGVRAGLIMQLGNDVFCRYVAERMEAAGLPLDLVDWIDAPLPTITVGVSLAHDRLFLSYARPRSAIPPRPRITLETVAAYRPRVIITLGDIDLGVCRAARSAGGVVYLDTYWNRDHLHSRTLRELAREADIFAPNLHEAREITGKETAEEALEVLHDWCPCVVIKCGAAGCLAWREGIRLVVPAIPVTPVDTTGAGDNFNAGLIYGLLQGYPLETCLRCANIAGGLSTRVLGGSAGDYTAADIERWLVSEPGRL